MKKIFALFVVMLFVSTSLLSQQPTIYPSHWWTGMKNPSLQLMIHADQVASADIRLKPYPGVQVKKITKAENPNYVFIDLNIAAAAKPGQLQFQLDGNKKSTSFTYQLKQRRSGRGSAFAQGVRSEDFIYLIMPDRFANGDYSNDIVKGMQDERIDRDSIWLRHGGDIEGVISKLDYLKDLGITTVWLTPVFENNMLRRSEHGYAITNHFKVDPRLGTNDTYKKLGDELHKRGMKLIQDAVYNHSGLYHPFIVDLPMKDWIHQWPNYTNPNYKEQTLFDPYAAQIDKRQQLDGWFDRIMPDLNQANPYMANFLIQHAIWSVEEFGLDGFRIDTYIYCDLDFMNRCNQALMNEYPNITMFGECWVTGTANQAYFARNNFNVPFKSNLPGVKDFQALFDGIYPATKKADPNPLYQVMSNDFMYENPMNNVVFLDNHDMTRFYSEVGEDVAKLKMGLAWLLTTRGIPQLYYGTEVLMTGKKERHDGFLRKDFPGGWREDKENKFLPEGRSGPEDEIFNYVKTLANYRKKSLALKQGRLMQYVPENGVYTYFRYNDSQTIMVVINSSEKEKTITPSRFIERTKGFSSATNVVSGVKHALTSEINIPAQSVWVLELMR